MNRESNNPADMPDIGLPRAITLRDGRGCLLRSVTEQDAEALVAVIVQADGESDFLGRLPGEHAFTLEEEIEFIRANTGENGLLLVAQMDGNIVAIAGATLPERRRFRHQCQIGITVLACMWGQGLGRAMMGCLLDWGSARGLRKACLHAMVDNDRAIALYRSLGFVEEGRLHGDALRADGRFTDTIIMAKFYEPATT